MKLSIIIPVIKDMEFSNICEKIKSMLKKTKYEILFISCDKNDLLDSLYNDDMLHIKIIYLSKSFDYNLLVQAGFDNACGDYSIVIDDNFDFNNLDIMIKELDNDNNLDIISTGFEPLKNEKLDTSGYRLVRSNVRNAIKSYKFSNKIYSKIGFNTKYLNFDNNINKYSIVKELNKMSLYCFGISIIFLLILLISLIVSLIIGFDIDSLILLIILFNIIIEFILIGIIFISKYKDKYDDYIIKNKVGFGDKDIL